MTPHKVTPQFWDHATLWSDYEEMAGHTTDGGRVFGITRTRYAECDRYGCSPVAVIPFEDREQIERLAELIDDAMTFAAVGRDIARLAEGLREFANPTPPKPEEPTAMAAVVEDKTGRYWIRVAPAMDGLLYPWHSGKDEYAYDDIAAVRVLSDGVQP